MCDTSLHAVGGDTEYHLQHTHAAIQECVLQCNLVGSDVAGTSVPLQRVMLQIPVFHSNLVGSDVGASTVQGVGQIYLQSAIYRALYLLRHSQTVCSMHLAMHVIPTPNGRDIYRAHTCSSRK